MSDKKKERFKNEPDISFNDLKLKQSVRTTFKLPRETINLLGLIAGQLGIKQKSLLDQLTEDKELLTNFAQKADQEIEKEKSRFPKTFVISRSTLESINEVAKRQNVPRDFLVEFSIQRLVPVIENELEKHQQRKKIFEEMKEYMDHGEKLRRRAKETLGDGDELYDMINKQVLLTQKNILKSLTIIEKGSSMEDW